VNQTEASTPIPQAPALGVSVVGRTIRSYILLFVFFTPYWINYKDKPIERNPHPTGVSVLPDTQGGFLYEIEGAAISAREDAEVRDQLLGIIEPIAGAAVTITGYQAVHDSKGRVVTYKVWVRR
jgi:hypothetical protein